ncbi:MAG: cytochrome-c peroxidase [Gemmatimonadetes bacterium]|nr:cytochrome-c peroxidase [Gemmatimonadota bacterium]
MRAALGAAVLMAAVGASCRRSDVPAASTTTGATTTIAASFSTATPTDSARASAALDVWRAAVDTLAERVDVLTAHVKALRDSASVTAARHAFSDARRAFKHAEIGLEYYAPSTTREMNGPALPEVEESEGPEYVVPPMGFQVIEEQLFGDDPVVVRDALVQEVITLQAVVRRAQTMLAAQRTTSAHVFDAARLELARITTLGLAGFDSPVADAALPEAVWALEGVTRSLAPWQWNDAAAARWQDAGSAAARALRAPTARNDADFASLIADYLVPLAHALQALRTARGVGVPQDRRAFRLTAASPLDAGAFDVAAFSYTPDSAAAPSRAALGERLFTDRRLSRDGQRACTSCHVPSRAFTDGLRTARATDGSALARNTPTIINVGLQVGSFADLRTAFLEDQVTDVIENAAEMHGSLAAVAGVLARDTSVVSQFRTAFGSAHAQDSTVTPLRIRAALAAYMRSLSRLDAPVDRALRGDAHALTDAARRGLNLFVGKARCASCHFLPLTNGTVPPAYQRTEVEVLGVPQRADTAGASVDADVGRFRVTRAAPHRHAFRTPSLRNVALTAPYMHNGAYRTLEQVIDFYARGGGAGIGVHLDNQTLPRDRLDLSARDRRDLVAFLEALTDTSGTQPGGSLRR